MRCPDAGFHMKVIICGAGQVGFGIAERLSAEQNDVVVIDNSQSLVQTVSDRLDVQGIVGHASYPDILHKAGADDADMIIAVTFIDEVNMMACQVAHSLFDIPTKIARVRAQSYLSPEWQDLFSRDNMPIDVIISPEIAAGDMVLRRLAFPGAFDTMQFADATVTVIGIVCHDDCPVIDTPLTQLTELFPDLKAVVVGIVRDSNLFVPKGADQMLAGDEVYLAAERDQVERTLGIFGHDEKQAHRIIIAGGGIIGLYVAGRLEAENPRSSVKIIEANRDRAILVADQLKRTVVLHGSANDQELLREADVREAEAFVALTNDDKVNLIASVMAKREGTGHTLALVNGVDYVPILKSLGIDAYINPRATTVSTILQHVRRGRIRAVHSVQNGSAEIIEAEALETSPLVDKPLREADLPDGVRIGAIVRDGSVVYPSGDSQIKANDRVIIFALAEHVRVVEHLFRVSLEFF
jgi:trk system potassium uptake protein TrkA